jgi:hypothetical protein
MSKKFNKESTALEVVEGISLNGLIAIVTGNICKNNTKNLG